MIRAYNQFYRDVLNAAYERDRDDEKNEKSDLYGRVLVNNGIFCNALVVPRVVSTTWAFYGPFFDPILCGLELTKYLLIR